MKKWYQNTVFIIALLILFFPVGLFLMWKYTSWNKIIKWVITGFFVIVLFGSILGSKTDNSSTSKTTAPTQAPQAGQATNPTKAQQSKLVEPKKDTSELNASVRQVFDDPPGIEVINNETSTWYGCEFVLNNDYKKQYNDNQGIGSGKSEALTIPFVLFTKSDGTRFNFASTAPKTFLIECTVNGNLRNNVYEF